MLFQCVPNFSEGRRSDVVTAIAVAMQTATSTGGSVHLIDHSADPDHNRCVMTLLGDAQGVKAALLAGSRVAVAHIDLRTHAGVHPRTGAIDVVPVVALGNTPSSAAISLAHDLGEALAKEHGLPVYFYEDNYEKSLNLNAREWMHASNSPNNPTKNMLPELRRGGYEAFVAASLIGERTPDLGPTEVHPSAGVVIVGARAPLVAYNIDLGTPDVIIARKIARHIRQERPHVPTLAGVRALGLYLASRGPQGTAQVSMNLTRPNETPLPAVFDFVRDEAASYGVYGLTSEIIGVIPRTALGNRPPAAIRWDTYRPTQILDIP